MAQQVRAHWQTRRAELDPQAHMGEDKALLEAVL